MRTLVAAALLLLPTACTVRVVEPHTHHDHGCDYIHDYSGCAMWSPETGACVPRTTTRRLANAR